MKAFKEYLLTKKIVPEKRVPYYISWVSRFYEYCNKETGEDISHDEIERYTRHLSSTCEDWQVKQAREAIKLYQYAKRKKIRAGDHKMDVDKYWKAAADKMVKVLRLKHRALSTEKSYMGWLRSFYHFLNGLQPTELDDSHFMDFMSYLAIERKVAKSTQNQDLSAVSLTG